MFFNSQTNHLKSVFAPESFRARQLMLLHHIHKCRFRVRRNKQEAISEKVNDNQTILRSLNKKQFAVVKQ